MTDKPKTPTEILHALESIVIHPGDPTVYEFTISGKKIQLQSDKLLNSNGFRIAWLDNFHELIAFNTNEWGFFVKGLLGDSSKITILEREEITPVKVIAEKLIRDINSSIVVAKLEDALERGKVWFNGKDEIFVYNDVIQHAINGNKAMTISQLRMELSSYIAGKSEPRKINKDSYRFWRFKKDKLTLDVSSPIDFNLGEENETV